MATTTVTAGETILNMEEIVALLYDTKQLYIGNPPDGGDFKLRNERLSPLYMSARTLGSYPVLARAVAEEMSNIVAGLGIDHILGAPQAGTSLAATIATVGGHRYLWQRVGESKAYGAAEGELVGDYQPGETVAIIDNVINDGGAKLELVNHLIRLGLVPGPVVVMVDLEGGGRRELAARGIELHSMVTMSVVIDLLERQKRISYHLAKRVRDYMKDPDNYKDNAARLAARRATKS